MEEYVIKFVSDDPRSWDKMSDLLFAYREVPFVTIDFSPFELILVFSGKPQLVVTYIYELRERLKQCSQHASEHASDLQVRSRRIMIKIVAGGHWRQVNVVSYCCRIATLVCYAIAR